MIYEIKKAKLSDKEILYNYKILSILDFNDMSKEEKQKVSDYINNSIDTHISDYNLILIDNKIIGCYCSYIKNECFFLDEIYIEKEYRNLGIGTEIIKQQIENAKVKKMNIELWVYKENIKAINLYKRLNFVINTETENRYLMKLEIEK